MTLAAHIAELADCLGARVLHEPDHFKDACDPYEPCGEVRVGQPFKGGPTQRFVLLSHSPIMATAYLVALHELGHLASDGRGPLLAEEAIAWDWAIAHSLIPLGPGEWTAIRDRLRTYAEGTKNDRRFKQAPAFHELLATAERNAQ